MRDTKDIADAVFRIRDEHLEQMKKKRIRMEKACAAVSAVAAAGVITFGALHYTSANKKPVQNTDVIPSSAGTTELPSGTVTTLYDASGPVSTYTTAVTASSSRKSGEPVTSKTSVSRISSDNKNAASKAAQTTAAAAVQTPTTTDISEIDCEEVIRMKVISIKKYLAALSAGAISIGAVNMPANAENMYTPREIDPLADAVLFIEDNPDLMDFDGNGKLDGFDAYALCTYLNEPGSLPEGCAERCRANADFNKDGVIDTLDTDLFREICYMRYISDNFITYSNNMEYLLPADTDYHKHVYRTVSPDAPAGMREALLNEFVDESYTYGSNQNKNAFIDYCFFNNRNSAFPTQYTFDKYNDAYYKRFVQEIDRVGYSFDVNEDGAVDLKDLYDIFIYDVASADDGSQIAKNYYFGQFNNVEEKINGMICIHDDYEHPLRSRLPMPEEFKDKLWAKCEPMYNYVNSFIEYNKDGYNLSNLTVFDMIGRYILEKTEFDRINTSNVYYVDYHGDLMLCEHSVSEEFLGAIHSILDQEFDKTDTGTVNDPLNENPKYHTLIADYQYMHDNDYLRAVNAKAKEEFESGLTSGLYDINKDGKTDYLDTYTFELFISDLAYGRTAEESILPADQWNFIDQKVDLDKDDIAGTFIDFSIFQFTIGYAHSVPSYKLDIYYLQLIEQKGLIDISDIKPYIEKLCKDKEAGDVDLDGQITAIDASEVLKYYSQLSVDAEINTVTEAKMEYMADFNTDGFVDSVDASAILRQYALNSVEG